MEAQRHEEVGRTDTALSDRDREILEFERHWWKYALADLSGLWAGGCLIGMFLNVNLALALVTPEIANSPEFANGISEGCITMLFRRASVPTFTGAPAVVMSESFEIP